MFVQANHINSANKHGSMKPFSQVEIINRTKDNRFKDNLYRCIVGPPSKRCSNRIEYLNQAIPEGFQKKLLFMNCEIVGQIEYSPAARAVVLAHGLCFHFLTSCVVCSTHLV
jgi:hypothetical protein